ncbi:diguanylate cyclase (GGDEF) domain-containing protein [Burkholderiales bacterium JOSHI_001]|nr:diguanylate cyclase (GGDEF) domain-containing protein [Burkholderiales bacterium JOSHI_001]
MERLLTLIAALVAGCVALLLPGVSFYAGHQSQHSILRTEAEDNARAITRLVNDNPELWRVVVPRLEMLLGARASDRTPEIRTLFDEQGQQVARSADALAAPLMTQTYAVFDAGRPVGQVWVQRSLRPLLLQTGWFALLGALLGSAVFLALRVLPLRALRQSNARLTREATHDALTDLPNRALFNDRLEQAMLRAQRHKRTMALMFLDLDNFKDINDSLGHATGDLALRLVAQRLQACLDSAGPTPGRRAHDGSHTLARLGGDEFTVLLESAGTVEQISAVAEGLLDSVRQPLPLDGRTLHISSSLGIALFPRDDVDAGSLMRHADMAMYRAKELGRNSWQFFNDELNRGIQDRIALDQALRRALDQQEFLLHYQPKSDLASGRITGVEALLRWQRPGVGLVAPDKFIGALEENRLIVPVGAWVIETACAQLRAWDRAGMPPLSMAVNLSVRQFRDPELVDRVQRVLQATGLAPQRLELELTESLLMDDNRHSQAVLNRLSALGVRVAIDDFGTGYSSLAYLKRFKLDTLKLDRSFVRDLPADTENGAIAGAVVAMAHALKLQVVCEGVETQGQHDFLQRLGCDGLQGFWLARPMPAPELPEWWRRHSPQAQAEGLPPELQAAPDCSPA